MKEQNLFAKSALVFTASLGATLLTLNFHYFANRLPIVKPFAKDTFDELVAIHPNRQKTKEQIKREKKEKNEILKAKKERIHNQAVEIYEKRKNQGQVQSKKAKKPHKIASKNK